MPENARFLEASNLHREVSFIIHGKDDARLLYERHECSRPVAGRFFGISILPPIPTQQAMQKRKCHEHYKVVMSVISCAWTRLCESVNSRGLCRSQDMLENRQI